MSRLFKLSLAVLALSVPTLGWTQGKIAVVDVQGAILQTDVAQKRVDEIRNGEEFKKNKLMNRTKRARTSLVLISMTMKTSTEHTLYQQRQYYCQSVK